MPDTYHVQFGEHGRLEVSRIGRIALADNGRPGDYRKKILLAHGNNGCPCFVLTTASGDHCLGWIKDGAVMLAGGTAAWDDFGFNPDAWPSDTLRAPVAHLLDGEIVRPEKNRLPR